MAASENTGLKGTVKRILIVILITLILGSVWFYVYALIGLSNTRQAMPEPLWEALKTLTPLLIVTAGILYIASWRGVAWILYAISLFLVITAWIFDMGQADLEQQTRIENNQHAAELAMADAEQVLACDNGEKLLVIKRLATIEMIPVIDILLVQSDGQLLQRPLASTGLRDVAQIQPEMQRYVGESVHCYNEQFSSAAELPAFLEQFIADNQPRLSPLER